MILKSGIFKIENEEMEKFSPLGMAEFKIDKALSKKNMYTIYFKHIADIFDFWRRESRDRYEIHVEIGNIILTEENSSVPFDENFESFLIENIGEYFKECENLIRKCFNSYKTLEEVIEDESVKIILNELNNDSGTKEERIKFIESKLSAPY